MPSSTNAAKGALVLLVLCLSFNCQMSSAAKHLRKLSAPHGSPRIEFQPTSQSILTKKSLGILKLVLSPLLVPLLLPIFIVGIGLLIFFLFTGAQIAANSFVGRNYQANTSFVNPFASSVKLVERVLKSDECVKRISCEISRTAQGYSQQDWIMRCLKALSKAAKWTELEENLRSDKKTAKNCKIYSCNIFSAVLKHIKPASNT